MNIKLLAAAILVFASFQAQAALEYIRIAGVASDNCSFFDGCPYTLDDFGLVEGQYMYFDFLIDTDFDDPLNPDSSFRDYFAAILLQGTEVGLFQANAIPIAVTTNFIEGNQTQILDEQNGLAIGTRISGDPDLFNQELSIDNWVIGTELDLFVIGESDGLYAEFVNTSIANLSLVYRGDTPPPAVVPVPAAFWLLFSALGSVLLRFRK